MKKLACTLLSFLVLFINPSYAVTTIENPLSAAFKDIPTTITTLSRLVGPIAGLTFLAITIYGGYVKLTAAGNADQEEKAKKILTAGVIGLIIIIIAPVIVNLIAAIFNVRVLIS